MPDLVPAFPPDLEPGFASDFVPAFPLDFEPGFPAEFWPDLVPESGPWQGTIGDSASASGLKTMSPARSGSLCVLCVRF